MTCSYQLAFYRQGIPERLLAVVRYTMYEDDGKVSSVDTIEYGNNSLEKETFQGQVISSLECGLDVSIMTSKEIKDFPLLDELLNQ